MKLTAYAIRENNEEKIDPEALYSNLRKVRKAISEFRVPNRFKIVKVALEWSSVSRVPVVSEKASKERFARKRNKMLSRFRNQDSKSAWDVDTEIELDLEDE